MFNKIFFSLFILLLSLTASAQSITISGKITDDGGAPVPFASIHIKNTTKGTSANADGDYALTVSSGNYDLLFTAIGYKTETRKVIATTTTKLNITLAISSYQLGDVVIRPGGEDPAYSIVRKAIRKRKVYLNEVNAYSCEVYLKGLQKLLAAPKKFLGRDINQIAREYGLDSNRRGIVYLSESQSKLNFEKPGKYHEEMISSKVSGSNRAFSFNRASDIKVNLYENYQTWDQLSDRPLISPIADNAFSFYNYKWLGTTVQNGETINKIQLLPKHNYDPVFSGIIYITENSWRINSFAIEITKSANLNIVDTLKIQEQYSQVDRKIWMPASIKFEFTGGIFGFRFGGYFISVYSDYNLNPVINKKEFAEVLRVPQGVNKKDSLYWQRERPVPLTAEEVTDYEKKDILAKKRESKPYLDSLDRIRNRITPTKLFLTGYLHRNRYEQKFYALSPILTSVLYNTVEGFTINYGASYIKQIDSINNKYLRIGANVRYGFGNRRAHATASATIPFGGYTLNIAGGNSVYDINYTEPFNVLFNSFNTLFRRLNLMKFYEKTFLDVSLSHRISGGWRGSIFAEYASRLWLPNSTLNYISNIDNNNFTSNNPYTPNADIPLFPKNQSFKIRLHTNYNFSNKYVTYPTGRYYLPSVYPTLAVDFTKGFKNVFSSDVDYSLLTASLTKTDIPVGRIGKSSFYLQAGKFLSKKQLYYVDYVQFLGNNGVGYSLGVNTFLLLDPYIYSTPDKFVEAHYEHNFGGYFLNNVPLIRKLKLQEIVNINYVGNPQVGNFTEVAGGVQYLNFRILYGQGFRNGRTSTSSLLIGIGLPQRPANR